MTLSRRSLLRSALSLAALAPLALRSGLEVEEEPAPTFKGVALAYEQDIGGNRHAEYMRLRADLERRTAESFLKHWEAELYAT